MLKKIKKLLLSSFLLPIIPILSIPDDGNQSSEDGKNDTNNDDNNKNDDNENDSGKETNKTDGRVIFDSQDDFDALIQSRINKAVKKKEEEMAANKAKESMTEIERLKAEKEESDKKALAATNKANRTLIKAEVISQATKLNIVDPSAAFALMDLDNVTIDDNGNVKGVGVSLKALIKEKSYLVNENHSSVKSSGDDQNAGAGKKKKNFDMNALIRRAAGRGD